ncbi:ADP-dependent (S)-NAD(P)H-hydrate dehydratase [Sphingomonas sp. DBB INV C78]|uniref:NAD(P)H-hydrate dehydratase n=1 Tax=Sphingomonas sp. DBB INV C78 TaxID=3349434 RepID=UPI0036D27488
MGARPIDAAWRRAHPLPVHARGTDKNERGRVLLVGGAEFVPGALRLSGEAALRAGCGKLQLATVAHVAMALGVLMPEAAMIALPAEESGEISVAGAEILSEALDHCDTLILGPGMSEHARTTDLVRQMLAAPRPDLSIVLDAAAATCAAELADEIRRHEGRVLLTPHHGEMAALTGRSIEEVAADPLGIAQRTAEDLGAVVAIKSAATFVTAPGAEPLAFASECIGLATGGSGDVLAGIIGGLLSRGTPPQEAAAWGVAIHAEAGHQASRTIGPIGFLASDLLMLIPRIMAGAIESPSAQ